ncbi:MAG: HAD family hydrolase [Erysipelotrichaceae bacterium]|nr:HAD family hydrolase [Erysipelotrichaceae bacterium]
MIWMFDLDGTLLSPDVLVTGRTRKALHMAHDAGIRLGIATGRPVSTVEKMMKKWGLDDVVELVVGMNGSHVKDLKTGQFWQNEWIPAAAMQQLYEKFKDSGAEFIISDENYVYNNAFTSHAKWIQESDMLTYVETDYTEELKKDWPKLAISFMPEELEEMVAIHNTVHRDDLIGNVASKWTIEYTHANASKGKGIELLAKEEGVSLDEVWAFGDADNDLSMLKVCGKALVMANGTDNAKALADEILPPNTEDGIAQFIEKYLKEDK